MKKLIVQHRRGTKSEWLKSSEIPKEGELVVEQQGTSSKIKIGDGNTEYESLPYVTDELAKDIDTTNKRIDQIIALEDVDKTNPMYELRDIRIGYDGIDHASAGEAVRSIGTEVETLRNSLSQFIDADAVDGLVYEDNMLYLTANGQQVGDAVGPISGGTGTGGGGSSFKVRLTNLTPGGTNFSVTTIETAIIQFQFISVEDEIPTGDFTCIVEVNGVKKQTSYLQQNDTGHSIDVTSYLAASENKVKLTCTDIYGNSRTIVYNIEMIELTMKSAFNSNVVYKNTSYPDGIDFRYSAVGVVDKTVHFLINGTEVATRKLAASTSGKEVSQVFPMSLFTHGSHRLTVYATASIDEKDIVSNSLMYDLLIHVDGETAPMISSTIDFTTISEGELLSIPFIVFDPDDALCNVILRIYNSDGTIYQSDTRIVDQTLQTWSTRRYPVGDGIKFSIIYHPSDLSTPIVKTHTVNVTKSTLEVFPEEDPKLYLSAVGRSNNESDPARWTFENISTTFTNFNWKSNGWIQDDNGDTCLRLAGGAQATINFAPFSEQMLNIQNNGLTVEFEFAIRDVNNRDTVVIDCFDGTRGIRATADTAFIKSTSDIITCRYKDEEKIKLTFTVEKDGKDSNGYDSTRFLSVYLDGVLSGILRYESNDFNHNNYIRLGDAGCTLDLYTVRIYNKALTAKEVTSNYIADIADTSHKLDVYEDNDIYTTGGKLSYEELRSRVPTITFTGQMPTRKGDKKVVLMDFENPFDESKSFRNVYGGPIYVLIDVQGTSSQWYVRKNWKIKLKDKKYIDQGVNNKPYQHMDDEIPASVFCIKVDYAEGTGTHNTQNANLIETLYSELIPPQKDDDRVRTTITGFPCVIFEKETESSDPVFSSKGNFNFDKGAEDAFGFNENYDVECWEFCNNTSDSCNFIGEVPRDWVDDFEPRYTPFGDEFDEIESLQELKDAATDAQTGLVNREQFSLEDEERLLSLRDTVIAEFKKMHDWVVSTKDDLGKFKDEFEDYFDLHYSLIYYVYSFVALMTDQRAKNMFLTRWTTLVDGIERTRWYPYFYDNDTSYGINNEGYLIFDYYHEDIDQVDGVNVYNGQNSVLWNNFRKAFAVQIKQAYSELRSSGKLTYDKIINQFITQGSERWSASIYNEDAEFKYITMARPENAGEQSDGKVDTANLYQVKGDGEAHLKYFVQNRLKYCDSKWYAGDYPSDYLLLRINTPKVSVYSPDATDAEKAEIDASNAKIESSLAAVPANPVITVTPYSDMYCGVRYKANGTLLQSRCKKNVPTKFGETITEVFNDTETAIFGASELAALDSLAGLYLSVLDTRTASKLTRLIVGDHHPDYRNTMLREVNVGANKLLKIIDITNCEGLNQSLGLSHCDNIEEVYALGTSITGVTLPSAGYLKVLHVPNTITELMITNHPELKTENVKIGDSGLETQNITRLCIVNCTELDGSAIFESCLTDNTKLERVRLTDVNWTNWTIADIQKLYTSKDDGGYGLKGLDANNNPTDIINISGTCMLSENVSGEVMADIVKHLPYLHFIMYPGYTVTSVVQFMNNDGTKVLWTETVSTNETQNITCPDPVVNKNISAPVKDNTAKFNFIHNGWSIQPALDRVAQEDALKNILGNRVLYPTFSSELRSYTYRFVTVDQVMYTGIEYYGNTVRFDSTKVTDDSLLLTESDGDVVPKKYDSIQPELYEFTGWYPSTDNIITGDTTFYAQFLLSDEDQYNILLSDIHYSLDEVNKELTVTKYLNTSAPIVSIPATYTLAEDMYTTTRITGYDENDTDVTGFSSTNVELVVIPDSVKVIDVSSFENASKLVDVTIGESVEEIKDSAFKNCTSLDVVKYNAVNARVNRVNTSYSDNYPFAGCGTSTGFKLIIGPNVTSIPSYLFYVPSYSDSVSVVATIDFSTATNCTEIGTGAFMNCNLRELQLPSTVKTIKNNAFTQNTNIEELVLPEGVETIEISAFHDWEVLKTVHIPASLLNLRDGAFRHCSNLTNFIVAEGSKYRVVGGALVDSTMNRLIVGTAESVIDSSVEEIAGYAFAGCNKLTSISIPEKITTLNTDTFASCTNLSDVTFSDNLISISGMCFYMCSKLSSVTLPRNLQQIDVVAFAYTPIRSIDLPESVSKLGINPFLGCSELEKVIIRNPEGVSVVKDISGRARLFEGCSKLKTINVGWTRDLEVDGVTFQNELYLWGVPDPSNVTIKYAGEWED